MRLKTENQQTLSTVALKPLVLCSGAKNKVEKSKGDTKLEYGKK